MTGGTVTYHRAKYDPDRRYPWMVWFTDSVVYNFTAAAGEAMGLTPPEPAPLVVTCNGHSIELSDEWAEQFVISWTGPLRYHGEYDTGNQKLARLLRDARQDPQTASEPCPHCNDDGVVHTHDGIPLGPCDCTDQPAPADSDTLDFDAMPIGTVLWDASDSDFLLRFPGGWSYNPPADEDDYYDIDADIDKFTLVYQPAPVSPSEGLRAVLAGRDDADELIEYAATSYRSDRVLGPGRHLLSAVGDAARSGGV